MRAETRSARMRLREHRSGTLGAAARGAGLGRERAEEIRTTILLYREFFREIGISSEQEEAVARSSWMALADWHPELAEELGAMAEAAGTGVTGLMAVTARTEILALVTPRREGECSTAVLLPKASGVPETMQTWDWHESLVPAALLWEYTGSRGVEVRTFTEFGAPAKIGVNSAGLGLHFNILHHVSDHPRGGVPVHAVARRILDEASSVAEAAEIARSARVSASTVLTVAVRGNAGAGSEAASIEICPQGVAVVAPDAGGALLHTNHFLDPGLAAGEQTPDASTTYARLAHLAGRAPELAGLDASVRARSLCGSEGAEAPICFSPEPGQPPEEQWTTLLTIVLDTASARLECAVGNPMAFAEGPRTVF